MSIAEHNQFLQRVWAEQDREQGQWEASQKAIKLGHKPDCKWVTVLRDRQAAAHESWCDCGEWKKSGREDKWRKEYN